MLIVLDTNVLVSGSLNPFGTPGRILDLLLTGVIRIAYDDRILAEYAEVLARPRFGFDQRHVQVVLSRITSLGTRVTALPLPVERSQIPDPSDLPFAEVAIAGCVAALVTGNMAHFAFVPQFEVLVLPPAAFLNELFDER
ncbi:MAG: putative toxin-antitoxin system toxin component, PIN family [Chloroflexi bacterium]|nr:putative toxin-antitoxin system toxin component, PIN family [Chloroflexota bacterium]